MILNFTSTFRIPEITALNSEDFNIFAYYQGRVNKLRDSFLILWGTNQTTPTILRQIPWENLNITINFGLHGNNKFTTVKQKAIQTIWTKMPTLKV